MFSKQSEVTVVLTSCGRFDLLAQTLTSFFEHNTYPIRKFILVEDSGKDEVRDAVPDEYRNQFDFIINKPKLGQVASIDRAYSQVETKYIFHCEDDWLFYRPGFMEDSIKILEAEEHALMVRLRSFHHDIGFHKKLSDRKTVQHVAYYRVTTIPYIECFSFNPELRRRAQYPDGGYLPFLAKGKSPSNLERILSEHYAAQGYYAVLLENDAVKHIGGRRHVRPWERSWRWKKHRNRLFRLIMAVTMFALGWWVGGWR